MIRYGIWLVFILLTSVLYWLLKLNPQISSSMLREIVWVVLLSSIAIFFIRLLQGFAFPFLSNRKGEKTDLINFIINIFLYAFAIVMVLKLGFGYNISGLLATSALITAIIGLAMQATLSNIIAGISLHVEQPFSIGDYVRVPERNIKSEGFIEAIRWRSIVIRRTDNSQVVIPNNQFAASMIEVLQKKQLIRAELLFSVAASIPPQKIKKLVTGILLGVKGVALSKGVTIRLKEKDDEFQTIKYALYFYPEKQSAVDGITATIRERMWYAFYRNDIFVDNTEYYAQFPTRVLDQLLMHHNLLNQFDEAFYQQLIRSGRRLLFTEGERVLFSYPRKIPLFLVVTGTVKTIVKDTDQILTNEMINSIDHNILGRSSSRIMLKDQEIVNRITNDLTVYIGPFSTFITQRVISQFSDPYYWYQILAHYIEDEKDQKIFLKDSPTYPSDFYESGDLIGLANFLLNRNNTWEEMYAQGELALLELDGELLQQWMIKKTENIHFLLHLFNQMMMGKNGENKNILTFDDICCAHKVGSIQQE